MKIVIAILLLATLLTSCSVSYSSSTKRETKSFTITYVDGTKEIIYSNPFAHSYLKTIIVVRDKFGKQTYIPLSTIKRITEN